MAIFVGRGGACSTIPSALMVAACRSQARFGEPLACSSRTFAVKNYRRTRCVRNYFYPKLSPHPPLRWSPVPAGEGKGRTADDRWSPLRYKPNCNRRGVHCTSAVLPSPFCIYPLPFRLNGRGASFAGSLLPLPCSVTRHPKTVINRFEMAPPCVAKMKKPSRLARFFVCCFSREVRDGRSG